MFRLWNIAMGDYQESVTTGQTHRQTEFEKGQNLYCQLVWDFYHVDDLFPLRQDILTWISFRVLLHF